MIDRDTLLQREKDIELFKIYLYDTFYSKISQNVYKLHNIGCTKLDYDLWIKSFDDPDNAINEFIKGLKYFVIYTMLSYIIDYNRNVDNFIKEDNVTFCLENDDYDFDDINVRLYDFLNVRDLINKKFEANIKEGRSNQYAFSIKISIGDYDIDFECSFTIDKKSNDYDIIIYYKEITSSLDNYIKKDYEEKVEELNKRDTKYLMNLLHILIEYIVKIDDKYYNEIVEKEDEDLEEQY